jgi:hypothetical protein
MVRYFVATTNVNVHLTTGADFITKAVGIVRTAALIGTALLYWKQWRTMRAQLVAATLTTRRRLRLRADDPQLQAARSSLVVANVATRESECSRT